MAGGTLHACMTSVQRKGSIVVVEGDIPPVAGVMAGGAVRAELTIVPVIVCMTGIAVLRRTSEHAICVTYGTLNAGMTAPQGECCIVVVEGDIPPTGRRMARSAVRAELTIMPVIACMAGEAILRSAAQNSILVTGCALDIDMTASQWKGGRIVVEDDVLPAARIVAPGTNRAELTLMGVFRLVA
jgi:hypothetical protein